jgi:outer membrane protein TolC
MAFFSTQPAPPLAPFSGWLAGICILFLAAPNAGLAQGGGASADALMGLKATDTPATLSLEEALAAAVEANVDLKIAKERITQQEIQVRRAWAAIKPQVSLNATYQYSYPEQEIQFSNPEQAQQQALLYESLANITRGQAAFVQDPDERAALEEQAESLQSVATELRNTESDPIIVTPAHNLNGNLQMSMVLFNGRSLPLILNAYDAVEMIKESTSLSKGTLLFSVARTYYGAVTSKKIWNIALQQLSRTQAQRDATKGRVELGIEPVLSLQRAELEYFKAKQQADAARSSYQLMVGTLGFLLDKDTFFEVTDPPPLRAIEAEASDAEFIDRAFESREELRVQKLALDIAKRQRTDAWMMFMPTVSLVAQARMTSNTSGFTDDPITGVVMVQGSIPLYDGGTRYAALDESASKIREELFRLKQVERRVESQVRGNLADLRVKLAGLESAKEALALAQSTNANAKALFDAGVATNLDVLDANVALFVSEVDFARAEMDLQQARMGLAHILGEFEPTLEAMPAAAAPPEAPAPAAEPAPEPAPESAPKPEPTPEP